MPITATSTTYTNPVVINPSTGEGIGGLGPGGIVTPEAIRLFLFDRADANILNNFTLEFSSELVSQAVMYACSEFNATAPFTQNVLFDGSNWPVEIPHALILGASSWILKSEAANQIRNQFSAQDGNIPQVGVKDKFGAFMEFSRSLREEFTTLIRRWKTVKDHEAAYGISASPLGSVNRF